MFLAKCRNIMVRVISKTRLLARSAVINYTPLLLQLWIFRLAFVATKNPDFSWYLGDIREKRGDIEGAIAAYQAAVDITDRLNNFSTRPNRQLYQFSLERARFKSGQAHAEDPFHHCRCSPASPPEELPANDHPGTFNLKFKYNGLLIKVKLKNNDTEFVDLLIDGTPFRRLKVVPGLKEYRFSIKRPALSHFPTRGEVSARTAEDDYLLSRGAHKVLLNLPHGAGDIQAILEKHGYLEKKGYVPVSDEEINRRQNYYLQLYARARDIFDAELDKPLFLMYGTLLGLYRDGDFIPGDDDFDVGYVSKEQDPVAVKEEAKRIITTLVRAGFTVSFNQAGRPFRLRDADGETELHLDVRPIWFQDGNTWAHKQACLPCTLDAFQPVQKSTMRGTAVYIPHDPELFLKLYYGPGWKVPDPSYSNDSTLVDPQVHRNLNLVCMSIGELKELQDNLQRQDGKSQKMGELIFKAARALYPLDEYEAKCGWC